MRSTVMSISSERLISLFLELIKIDSVSRNEQAIKQFLYTYFQGKARVIHEDNAQMQVNGTAGNLFIRIPGTDPDLPVRILSAHMDTITSTRNINPVITDGKIHTDGTTILGADNRAGVAVICEVIRSLQENNARYGDIEIVISVCEEVGLLGIKHFDFSLLNGTSAFVLDGGNAKIGSIVNKAPSATRFDIEVTGKAAHAGIAPENGINAIALAAKAIARIKQGKLNKSTTLNIGKIEGGKATNIIPDKVFLKGEIRSYSTSIIDRKWNDIQDIFTGETTSKGAQVSFTSYLDYLGYDLPASSGIVQCASKAFCGDVCLESSFGGSDANVFNQHGIPALVLSVGAWEPHTAEEYIIVDDFTKAAQWVYNIVVAHR